MCIRDRNIGDSFEVVFTLTFDPSGAPSALTNQATSSGNGIDSNGNPLGIQATDESDNGTDPTGENGEDDVDGTFGNDPTPINLPPIAVDETVTTGFETPVIIDPIGNDSHLNGDVITITEIAGVTITPGIPQTIAVPNGTVTVAADGTITVTPDSGFSGDIDVPYTIIDEDGETDTAVHTVEVPPEPEQAPASPDASGNIDLLTVAPPRPVTVSDNVFERELDRPQTDVELVLLNAVEELSSLQGADLASLINLDPVDLNLTEAIDIESVSNIEYEGSEGFSSGKGYPGTISVDPTDECGRFFIDTIKRDSMLSVITRSTIDPERSSGVIGFSATLANGEPLPEWISQIGDGEYLIDPSVGVETVSLKLTAHRASGWGLERYVEIDTATGVITEIGPQSSDTQVSQPDAAAQ